jgi:hypothetical protein
MADASDLLDRHSFLVAPNWRRANSAYAAWKISGLFRALHPDGGITNVRRDAARALHLIDINNC